MNIFRRVIALVVLATIVFGMLSVTASADPGTVTADTGELTVEGVSDLGELLAEKAQSGQDQTEGDYPGGYAVIDLVVKNSTATVTYSAAEDATLVVALYSEDGMKMVRSADTQVSAQETTAQVTFDGLMPQYFRVSAYLMRTADMVPLCSAFHSPMYTKSMQKLLKSDADDYDADRVMKLSEDKKTNFLVLAEQTQMLSSTESINTVTSANKDTKTYVIENADASVTDLQAGDIFVLPYGDNNAIITKVASIAVEGTTATIHGTDVALEEVFSHIKLETQTDSQQLQIEENSWGENVTYYGTTLIDPETGMTPVMPMFEYEDEGTITIPAAQFDADIGDELEGEHGSLEGEASVGIMIGVELIYNFYLANTDSFVELKAETGVTVTGEFSGSATGELIKLGKWGFEPIPGVFIGFEPFLGAEISLEGELSVYVKATAGLRYDANTGRLQNLCTGPVLGAEPSLEGTFFVGVDLNPTVEVLYGTLFDADLTALIGLFINGEMTGTIFDGFEKPLVPGDEESEEEEEIHECLACIDGDVHAGIEIGFELEVLDQEFLAGDEISLLLTYQLCDYYVCTTCFGKHKMAGLGECPEKKFLITVEVLDRNGNVVPYVNVIADGSESELPVTDMGKTNSNGVITGYIPAGIYTFTVDTGYDLLKGYVEITGAGKVRIDGSNIFYSPSNPGSAVSPILKRIIDSGTIVASGTCGEEGSDVTWTLTDGGLLEIAGNGDITQKPWTKANVNIKVVIINEGITGIGPNIFQSQNKLFSVTIPNSVKHIGKYAFYGCGKLDNITIPNGVTTIESHTFASCSYLTNLSIPDTVTAIGESAFYYCTSLENVIIPAGVTKIERSTFGGCSALQGVSLPNTVTEIEDNAFYGCKNLSQLSLRDSITSIGVAAFRNCSSLVNVTLPQMITEIPEQLFYGCTALESVGIPSGVTSIGKQAFYECSSLKAVTIPEGVTELKDQVFAQCGSLANVTIPKNVTTLGNGVFAGCAAFTDMVIPQSITQMGSSVFSGCSSLVSVSIPTSLTKLNYSTFKNCSSLASIDIPENITVLEREAFAGCASLKSVRIPSSITFLEVSLFKDCTSLETVFIPDSVTGLGHSAFSGCSMLDNVQIPDAVTSMDDAVFYNCSSLTTLKIPQGVPRIGDSAFTGCTSLVSIDIPDSVQEFGTHAFHGCSVLKEIYIPDGVTEIPYCGFYQCSGLKNVVIPDSVTSIGMSAFYQCVGLEWVNIPDYVTEIHSYAFQNCINLADVYLPEGLTLIGGSAFFDCDSFTSVTIPKTVTSMGNFAFSDCENLCRAYFEGDAPSAVAYGWFVGNKMDVYYPEGNATYTEYIMEHCEIVDFTKDLNWIPYTPGSVASVQEINTLQFSAPTGELELPPDYEPVILQPAEPEPYAEEPEPVEEEMPLPYTAIGGEYSSEKIDSRIVRTASFEGLIPGQEYTMLAVANMNVENLVAKDNLLYIAQVIAGEDGTVQHSYVQRTEPGLAFVMLCGKTNKSITDAEVVFPRMTAGEEQQTVNPTVRYNGELLTEGRDYVIEGTVSYTDVGRYTCVIRGIYDYIGQMECIYTVEEAKLINPFVDVKEGDFFYDAVLWAYYNNITTGRDATHFGPTEACTRAQVVTFLWRAAGSPEPASMENKFPDVADGKYFTKAVLWAAEQGITGGYKDGTFRPNNTCTRDQIVTFLWRYMGQPEPQVTDLSFPDVDPTGFYYKAVLWAAQEGVTSGYGDGTFRPTSTCRRDQIVTFLYRALVL